MTQRERDRLVALKKAQKKLLRQREAAQELGLSERHVRRLLWRLKAEGDGALVHGLRGRPSNRQVSEAVRDKAVRVLSQAVYRGFGPTLASEYLEKKHRLEVGRETLRQWMMAAGLWRRRKQKVEQVHVWRARRSARGELVQWDTSEHDWLEGRGEKIYLIHMIDDATSELTARFVRQDSTEENLRLLWSYLERHGRPLAFYTDKASLFQTAVKTSRELWQQGRDRPEMPPTQIGRALRELGIDWIAAHSPQAKGRIERSFEVAQDRLVKGMRVEGVHTLPGANQYLDDEFVPWWQQHLTVEPVNPTDAHRPLGAEHELAAVLSRVETRCVANDYTFQFAGQLYQIARPDIRPGLRGSPVRLEARLDGSLAVRFRDRYLSVFPCQRPPKAAAKLTARASPPSPLHQPRPRPVPIDLRRSLPIWQAAKLDQTRTRDTLD